MDRPTHILVECPELTASVRIGVLESLKPLELQGKCCIRFHATERISKEDIIWCDVFICVRGSERATLHVVQSAKRAGRYIVYFLDDDLLQVPVDTESGAFFQDTVLKESMIRIIEQSDILWGVNAYLVDKYRKLGNGRWVVSQTPATISFKENKSCDKIKILYAGSVDHNAMVQAYLSPALRRLCGEYRDQLEIVFIGADPKLDELPNVTCFAYIKDYDTYKRIVAEGGFQIGLAVIGTSEFYRCKYYNKFVEYTSIGAVGIYTDSEPYTLVVKNQENGLLCKNTEQSWYAAIKMAIEDPFLREKCLNNAVELIEQEFDPQQVANLLEEDLPELVNFKACYVKAEEISLNCVWWRFYWGRTASLWRVQGWKAIPTIVFRSVRKIVKTVKTVIEVRSCEV